MPAIELVTTDGISALDGDDRQVVNNIWLIGANRQVVGSARPANGAAAPACRHGPQG